MFPPASSPRRRRARLGVLALSALFLLGACTGQSTPTKYGDTTRTNFTKACVSSATEQHVSDPQGYCTCSYAAIVKQIPFEEFKKMNSDLSDNPDVLPPKLLKIRDDCLRSSG
jgi:hypothetical protein